MISDCKRSFGSRYFLKVANERTCFASCACAFKSSGLITCLELYDHLDYMIIINVTILALVLVDKSFCNTIFIYGHPNKASCCCCCCYCCCCCCSQVRQPNNLGQLNVRSGNK